MSGDVQPRKRKDKKRKRDSLDRRSEGEFVFSRKQSLQDDEPTEQHQGVHGSKMGNEDVHLHVQGDHETGGHWCAKLFFFSLLAILLGLIGLIILENRGLADLDTPLSESRFSNYFDGWVDEHREAHDEHDAVTASIEEHEHGDEPFEEEEDHSEVDEAEDDGEETEHDEEDDENDEDDEENTKESEDENDIETEEVEAETVEEEDADGTQEEEDEEENDEENTVEDPTEETQEDDENENDNANKDEDENDETNDEDDENEEANDNDDNRDDDDEDENTAEDVEPPQYRSHRSTQQASSQSKTKEEDDDDNEEPFEEEDDDGTFESLESVVVDNDAEELLILQEKARQQQASSKQEEPKEEEESPSYTSSLAVKIGVGVALALVARLVLVRKNPNTNEPSAEDLMRRRLTIAAPEDTFTEDHDELLEYDFTEEDNAMNQDTAPEEEYIEEEIVEEEEIEVTDEEYEEEKSEEARYAPPETFEQFNAMYRSKDFQQPEAVEHNTKKVSPPKTFSEEPKLVKSEARPTVATKISQSRFAQYHHEKTPPPQPEPNKFSQPAAAPTIPPQVENATKDVHRGYSDEHVEDIEYDDEELYDEEMLDEEEEEDIADDEEDEEDLSDVDDSELMNRLEAKYGRLPAKELDSDEDVEDQSWTKIKPRGGGPQSVDDDEFEEELKRANEEMLRENLNSALTSFESLSRKFPDKPQAFLGKAKILDKLSEINRSNSKLSEALDVYKRYLAFGNDVFDDKEFTEVAERCVDRMRFMGLYVQAVSIHEMLIERFPKNITHRNQLAVTYLMVNRLLDAKYVLEGILARWPSDGFAMVHYGFVLKNLKQNLNLAVQYLRRGIDSGQEGTQDGRFYFNLGDSYQRLGRSEEAREIYKRGAALKLFPSEYQRSLYNVDSLRAQAFWSKEETGYIHFLNQIENNWRQIRDEGINALNIKGIFEDEAENLRDSGDWKQLELFARGQRRRQNCLKTPITCGIIELFPSARFCKRGQVKFSVMLPGTHVWPHCGPTNCRLRAHLGLKVPPGTLLRVADQERVWKEGKFLIFDDSFEHEVWHNGTSPRLVLIVDIWHPDLTEHQRQSLSPI